MFIHILYRYFEGLSAPANAVLRNQFSGRWIAWLQAADEGVKYGEEIIYDYGFDPAEASERESSSEDEFVPRKRRKAVGKPDVAKPTKGNNTKYCFDTVRAY